MSPLALVLAANILASVDDAKGPRFSLRPELGFQGGTETFEWHDTFTDPSVTGPITGESKLTYPLGASMAGIHGSIGSGRWTFLGTLRTNLVDPSSTMTDQDWITVPAEGIPRTEFSHTDSKVTMRAVVLEVAARLRALDLAREERASFSAVAGFRLESTSFEVWGAHGWQIQGDTTVYGGIPDSILAGKYDTKYYVPFLGVRFDARMGGTFCLGLEARGLSAWSTHDDDHVLRHKTGHASMHALGYAFSIEPSFDLGDTGFAEAFLGVVGELQVLAQSDGTLHQHFYADDPSAKGDQTGVTDDGPFGYHSTRYRVLGTMELRF